MCVSYSQCGRRKRRGRKKRRTGNYQSLHSVAPSEAEEEEEEEADRVG